MTKKRLLVDMDGTLARFHDQAMYLERMYEKDFFRSLEPFENMVSAIRDLATNHPEVEVYTVSAKVVGEPAYCVPEKNAWLDCHLPEIDQAHRIYTDMGSSKASYIPGGVSKDDFLLDDYNKGLNLFLNDGGSAIKVMNNINMRGLGAYGGEKGCMWTGPLVTTQAHPSVIVGDLLEAMGLPREKERELKALELESVPESAWGTSPRKSFFLTEQADGSVRVGTSLSDRPKYCASFGDALKFLDAMRRGSSARELAAFNGFICFSSKPKQGPAPILLSGWKVEAISTNLGIEKQTILSPNGVAPAILERIQEELDHACEPIYGRIDYLSAKGDVKSSRYFHDPNAMIFEIDRNCNNTKDIPIAVEWYLQPKRDALVSTLQSRVPEPEPWEETDSDCLQHCRRLAPLSADFELCQIMHLPSGEYAICHGQVKGLDTMPEEELETYLKFYGYQDLDDFVLQNTGSQEFVYRQDGSLDRSLSPSWYIDYSLVAEMVFETDFLKYLDLSQTFLSWEEAAAQISLITGESLGSDRECNSKANTLSQLLHSARSRQEDTSLPVSEPGKPHQKTDK